MITSLRLQHFRSYTDESFEFEPGVNIVVGPNACGKTNLLEAILVCARGSSYRARDKDLLQHGQSWARLDGIFENESRVVKYQAKDGFVQTTFLIEDQPFKRLSLQRLVPVVLFEPNDLQLLHSSPDARRQYLDTLIEQLEPPFKTIKNAYARTLAQRNHLLKYPQKSDEQLFAWNIRLSQLGAQMITKRLEIIERINQTLPAHYSAISNQDTKVKLFYQSSLPTKTYASSFLKKLETDTQLDYQRGFTGSGPHRDDFNIELNGVRADVSASRGETRTIILAFKLFELSAIEKQYDRKPILLLDDVFSELDGSRRRYLVEFLKDHQALITTTDADAVIQYFTNRYNLIAVS